MGTRAGGKKKVQHGLEGLRERIKKHRWWQALNAQERSEGKPPCSHKGKGGSEGHREPEEEGPSSSGASQSPKSTTQRNPFKHTSPNWLHLTQINLLFRILLVLTAQARPNALHSLARCPCSFPFGFSLPNSQEHALCVFVSSTASNAKLPSLQEPN